MVTMPPEAARRINATLTTAGALTAGQHTPVDATSGPLTFTLPVSPRAGASMSVEKIDSTSNAVTVTGSIRGSTGSITLTGQYETLEFIADSAGSWHPIANHLPKSYVVNAIAAQAASDSATYLTYDGTHVLKNGLVVPLGGSAALEYTQGSAAASWGPIAHSLGRRPSVAVYDSNGDEVVPDIHATSTTVSLVFSTPMAGSAVLT